MCFFFVLWPAGIANRTTIADGNTWNHEHIALLGKTLTSSERDGHRVARHLADYILVWTGGGGDDLAKSPHLIRIANSVYRGLCSEPTCREFGYYVSIIIALSLVPEMTHSSSITSQAIIRTHQHDPYLFVVQWRAVGTNGGEYAI